MSRANKFKHYFERKPPQKLPEARLPNREVTDLQSDNTKSKWQRERRHLIDIYQPGRTDSWALRAVNSVRYTARRYIFDAAASFRVGDLAFNHPDLVAQNIEFARQPYADMYIEVNPREIFKARGQDISSSGDTRVGYVLTGNSIFVLAEGVGNAYGEANTQLSSTMGPLGFRLNTPQTQRLPGLFFTDDESDAKILRNVWVLGGQRERDKNLRATGTVLLPEINMPIEHFTNRFDLFKTMSVIAKVTNPQRFMYDFAFLGGGDPVICSAALLLLNQPSHRLYERMVPNRREMYAGKSVVFMSHSVVSVHLDEKESIRKLFVGHRTSPKGHEVEGHWVNYDKTACEHEFEPLDTTGDRFKCSKCSQRRTWRKQHIRGDASRGWVVKHYEVHK